MTITNWEKLSFLLLWQEVSNMWQSFSKCWGLDQQYFSLWSLRKTLENMSIWKREYMPIRMSEQSCFIIIALLYSSILHGFRRQREAYLARCEERTSVIHDRLQLTDHTPWPVHQSPLWTSNIYIVWPQTPKHRCPYQPQTNGQQTSSTLHGLHNKPPSSVVNSTTQLTNIGKSTRASKTPHVLYRPDKLKSSNLKSNFIVFTIPNSMALRQEAILIMLWPNFKYFIF